MRIDPVIEPRVREAFAAFVAQEPERFDTAIRDLGGSDDEYAKALELAFNIDAAAIFLIEEGDLPSAERLDYFADQFAESSSWAGVSRESARDFLAAIIKSQNPMDTMSPGDAAYAAAALGGWFLAGFPLQDGMEWTEFLDAVLLGLEQREQTNR